MTLSFSLLTCCCPLGGRRCLSLCDLISEGEKVSSVSVSFSLSLHPSLHSRNRIVSFLLLHVLFSLDVQKSLVTQLPFLGLSDTDVGSLEWKTRLTRSRRRDLQLSLFSVCFPAQQWPVVSSLQKTCLDSPSSRRVVDNKIMLFSHSMKGGDFECQPR